MLLFLFVRGFFSPDLLYFCSYLPLHMTLHTVDADGMGRRRCAVLPLKMADKTGFTAGICLHFMGHDRRVTFGIECISFIIVIISQNGLRQKQTNRES